VDILMPAPFDYTLDVVDPVAAMQSGMAFGQNMRANEQAMVMNDQTMGINAATEDRAQTAFGQANLLFDQAQQDRQKAMESAQAQQADLVALSEKIASGDYSSADFAAIAAKHPELVDEMGKMWDGASAERKASDVAQLFKGVTAIKAGRPDLAIQMLEDRAVAAENSGDQMEADIARATAEAIKADPNAGLTSLGLLLQSVDPDAATAVFGEGKKVQSTNAYANGTTVTVFTDGTKQVTDAAGTVFLGQEAIDMAKGAMASEAELRGANAGAAQTAKLDAEAAGIGGVEAEKKAAANNQEIVKTAQTALGTISSTIRNYDDAIAALDAGANTGVIASKIPTMTNAGALLENAKLRLGLDVIASVTFGALSEGERDAAMLTALPTNLEPAELRKWIQTRQAAEAKIAAIQQKAIKHFSRTDKSQRALAEEWADMYADIIPGVKEAFNAQFDGTPSAGAGSGSPPPAGSGDPALDALLKEAEGL
jgi:hypothetical protein